MLILFLTFTLANSFAVELSRRSLIQSLTAAAASTAVPKALAATHIDQKTAAFHRVMWIENELFNPQVLYDFALRQGIDLGVIKTAHLKTPYGIQSQIVLEPRKLIDLENQLSQKIFELNLKIANKWKLDPVRFTETILRLSHNTNRFPYAYSRAYKRLNREVLVEFYNELQNINPDIAAYFDPDEVVLDFEANEAQERFEFWRTFESLHRPSDWKSDPLIKKKIAQTLEFAVDFAKSKGISAEHLYEEIAVLFEPDRDLPWRENFIPRKFEVLEDQIVQEFLAQVQIIWPEIYLKLIKGYDYIKRVETNWWERYDEFYARNIHALIAFEEDLKRHQFQIPKDSKIWQDYLEAKISWGFDSNLKVMDQLNSTNPKLKSYFAKGLIHRFAKSNQSLRALTEVIQQMKDHLFEVEKNDEIACLQVLTNEPAPIIPIDLKIGTANEIGKQNSHDLNSYPK